MPTPGQTSPPGPPSPQASRPTGDPVVGAASSRPDRTGGTVGLAVNGTRPWRHEGMPPYGVQRGHGGKWGSFRAAASRPYGARLTWTVGRGAHTPPNQPAGTAKPTSIAPTGDPVVGAASSRLGPGAMCSGPRWFPWLVRGGHKALPYGPACDSAVGAGFIPARTRVGCVLRWESAPRGQNSALPPIGLDTDRGKL